MMVLLQNGQKNNTGFETPGVEHIKNTM